MESEDEKNNIWLVQNTRWAYFLDGYSKQGTGILKRWEIWRLRIIHFANISKRLFLAEPVPHVRSTLHPLPPRLNLRRVFEAPLSSTKRQTGVSHVLF